MQASPLSRGGTLGSPKFSDDELDVVLVHDAVGVLEQLLLTVYQVLRHLVPSLDWIGWIGLGWSSWVGCVDWKKWWNWIDYKSPITDP
jgi:hypothetical protein